MISWHDLQQYHLSPPAGSLARAPEVQSQYDQHRESLRESGIKTKDYIMDTYELHNFDLVVSANKFPYLLEPGIKHYIAWIQPGKNITTADIIAVFPEKNMVIFENNGDNKSIPEIPHYHIFTQTDIFNDSEI